MLCDPKALAQAVADLIEAQGGASDLAEVREVITLGLAQATEQGPNSLLPYEVLLIRIGKYVATQVPAPIYRDRARRAQIRRIVSELLIAQGMDPSGARIRA